MVLIWLPNKKSGLKIVDEETNIMHDLKNLHNMRVYIFDQYPITNIRY